MYFNLSREKNFNKVGRGIVSSSLGLLNKAVNALPIGSVINKAIDALPIELHLPGGYR